MSRVASSDNYDHLTTGFSMEVDGDSRRVKTPEGDPQPYEEIFPMPGSFEIGSTVDAQFISSEINDTINLVIGDKDGNPVKGIRFDKKEMKPRIKELP